MYLKDKKNRITLRLNENQFDFVKSQADTLGVSPSEYIRMLINSFLSMSDKFKDYFSKHNKEGLGRENDKTDIDDFV